MVIRPLYNRRPIVLLSVSGVFIGILSSDLKQAFLRILLHYFTRWLPVLGSYVGDMRPCGSGADLGRKRIRLVNRQLAAASSTMSD